jgi:hypothetical protein
VVARPTPFVGLSTKTENLGDHIQILAAERLLGRAGIAITRRLDRDDEIATNLQFEGLGASVGILLNGWFKTNPEEWPPHPSLVPLYLGFHIRLFRAPSLVSPTALEHYRAHGPIGCRDDYTMALLRDHGVEAFLSNCLTLTLPRRPYRPQTQTEVLVVSRDERLMDRVPPDLGPVRFISHYSGIGDFEANMRSAADLLALYRDRARLIVTDLLHCALPALAMAVPVVVFYPPNPEPMRQSDRERFSTLARMIRVNEPNDAAGANWGGELIDVGQWKLDLIDAFFEHAGRWWLPVPAAVGPIAAPGVLPAPVSQTEIDRLLAAGSGERDAADMPPAPDRARWAAPSSYKPYWGHRAALAASLVPDGARTLELGVGVGEFRRLVEPRCPYVGADLAPLSADVVALDLDQDPLPEGPFDVAVALGVFEYLHRPGEAARKMCEAAARIIVSYCAVRPDVPRGQIDAARAARSWVNAFTESEFAALFERHGSRLVSRTVFNSLEDFEQPVLVFASRLQA